MESTFVMGAVYIIPLVPDIVPVRVPEMVPVRVAEMVPVRVAEMVPVWVADIVPDFARMALEKAIVNIAAHAMDLAVFIVVTPDVFERLG